MRHGLEDDEMRTKQAKKATKRFGMFKFALMCDDKLCDESCEWLSYGECTVDNRCTTLKLDAHEVPVRCKKCLVAEAAYKASKGK
jgi:hypothetical protein